MNLFGKKEPTTNSVDDSRKRFVGSLRDKLGLEDDEEQWFPDVKGYEIAEVAIEDLDPNDTAIIEKLKLDEARHKENSRIETIDYSNLRRLD